LLYYYGLINHQDTKTPSWEVLKFGNAGVRKFTTKDTKHTENAKADIGLAWRLVNEDIEK
jgi:hypothetical protein